MRNVLIELNNYVAYKAAATVVLLTDSTAEKGPHEIAKPSYYHVTRGRGLQLL
jgi:hypothetical protein